MNKPEPDEHLCVGGPIDGMTLYRSAPISTVPIFDPDTNARLNHLASTDFNAYEAAHAEATKSIREEHWYRLVNGQYVYQGVRLVHAAAPSASANLMAGA